MGRPAKAGGRVEVRTPRGKAPPPLPVHVWLPGRSLPRGFAASRPRPGCDTHAFRGGQRRPLRRARDASLSRGESQRWEEARTSSRGGSGRGRDPVELSPSSLVLPKVPSQLVAPPSPRLVRVGLWGVPGFLRVRPSLFSPQGRLGPDVSSGMGIACLPCPGQAAAGVGTGLGAHWGGSAGGAAWPMGARGAGPQLLHVLTRLSPGPL